MRKQILLLVAVICILFSFTCLAEEVVFTPGSYTATANGHNGPLTVEVTFTENSIQDINIVSTYETEVVQPQIVKVADRIVQAQSLAIDTISGATIGSNALIAAVKDCIRQANEDPADVSKVVSEEPSSQNQYTADVIVIGAGGAGLASAVSAHENGASVIVIETLDMVGGSTIFSGGGFNTANPESQSKINMTNANHEAVKALLNKEPHDAFEAELQAKVREQYDAHVKAGNTFLFDSDEFFMLQTYNGGDYRGNPELIKILCSNSLSGYHWVNELGAKFKEKVDMGTGALWTRTHKPTEDFPTGSDVVYPFENYINNHDGVEIHFGTHADELIVDDNKVIGVKTTCDGKEITYLANKAVILATGGFGANVDMRVKYNTIWPSVDSSIGYSGQTVGARGDGILMAQTIGAELVDMELIQLHPNGEIGTGKMGTPGTSGFNMIFVNSEGKRFVAEDSRRDDLINATYAQDGAYMWIVCDSTKYPETNKSIKNAVELKKAIKADSLEDLAAAMGVSYENLQASVDQYNSIVDGEPDPLGLVNYDQKLGNPPYYARKSIPTVHHTMGGVKIDGETHVINTNNEVIPGLYACGEVTGGIHGANRLGGNAITDLVVFGRIAGENAAKE